MASVAEIKRILTHPLAQGGALLVASNYGAAGLHFITTIIAARLLGPADYGIVALAMAYPTLLWSFMGIKSVSVTTRYIAGFCATGEKEKLKSLCKLGYGLDLLVSVVAFVLVAATSWWVARSVYNMPYISWLMISYASSFPFASLTGTSWAILLSRQHFQWLAFFQIAHPTITLVMVVGFLLAGFGATGMVIAIALGQASIGIAMMLIATYMLYREGFGFWWNASLTGITPLKRELTSFFGWNYLMVTLSGLVSQIPLMLLGRLRGSEEAGFYRLATSLMTVGSYLESSLGRVAYPILSARWAAGERESLKASLKHWTLRGGILAGVIILMAIPFLPILLPLAFGSGFSQMVSGAQILMVGAAISAVFFWLNPLYYASGKVGFWTVGYLLYSMLIIGLSYPVIQRWGFFGLTTLITISKVIFTFSMFVLFLRSEKIHESLYLSPKR